MSVVVERAEKRREAAVAAFGAMLDQNIFSMMLRNEIWEAAVRWAKAEAEVQRAKRTAEDIAKVQADFDEFNNVARAVMQQADAAVRGPEGDS